MSGTATTTILVVEDDPIIRIDIEQTLEHAGYTVHVASDGLEAIYMARQRNPDLIVIDLGLPRLDGVETTRWIQEELRIPVIALTGRPARYAAKVIKAGATSCLYKPFHPNELAHAIATTLAPALPQVSPQD